MMNRILVKTVLENLNPGSTATVGGWVRTCRVSKGGFAFITINDGSCLAALQIVADATLANYEGEIVKLSAGCSVLVTGEVVESQGKGQRVELKAGELRVLGWADPADYPIQPKHHTMEFLRTQAHLRARTNTFGAVARVRNAVSAAIHEFFQSRGFIYLHTPIITASDCEGAGQLFRVSTLPAGQEPKDQAGAIDWSQDFFARKAYLTVSGQLEAETYACALGNVYTFGPTFRAENSNTPRHLAEFWMVEPEMAFCDLQGDARVAEEFLKYVFSAVLTRCPDDMQFFNERVDKTVLATMEHVLGNDFVRLSYTEAVDRLVKSGKTWNYPIQWGLDLQTEHERYITEEVFGKPVIISDYPASIKAFYMRMNDDQKTVAAMDVLVPRIGEIIGGSQREDRLDVLNERMRAMNLEPDSYWWYCDLRRYGSVPHAGFGLGLERVVQFITGMANIRDVIPYPRTPRSAEF
ncbi:MAG: asparagine--tRNA ligase [Planctomycetes bacterium]|nr:asparagine--tRNA ligase [Planctomycetota bacterium]